MFRFDFFQSQYGEDFELPIELESWYDMESQGAFKKKGPPSSAAAHVHQILDNTKRFDGKRVYVGLLRAEDIIQLRNS